MAKEYLDKTGLTYFWNKIKTYIKSHAIVKDDSGDLTIEGNYRNVHGQIGQRYAASTQKAITTAGIDTLTDGASLTLPPGTYVIVALWMYGTRSSTGNTNSQISIRNGNNQNLSYQRVMVATNAYSCLQTMVISTFTENTTVKVSASTSIPYTTETTNWISAVRIA